MNVKEAQKLTHASYEGPVIKPVLDHIYAKIKQAAISGRGCIQHPLTGLPVGVPYPTHEQEEVIWRHLESVDGYRVRHYPNPDTRDPRSCAFTEVRWIWI
jgi:hypothetical protein